MYSERIYLTVQELLDYEFKIDARGYRPQEVDKVLDMVIRDETEYLNTIKKLENDIKNLTNDNLTLKQEIRRLKLEVDNNSSNNDRFSTTTNNVDLIKRISQLEKIVYSKLD
ncbi:MAG: DivIVA domain-containing protein [bacterium]